jgi:hypothetical protein
VSAAYDLLEARKSAPPGSPRAHIKNATALLAQAARALLASDDAARAARGEAVLHAPDAGADIDGADALLHLLGRPPALAAPVEAKEAATALLQALATIDALDDAIGDSAPTDSSAFGR